MHLATFEHDPAGIEDQSTFLYDFANYWGVGFSTSTGLSAGCLNLVLEGVGAHSIERLANSASSLGVSVCMVVTENWAFGIDGDVRLNGLPCFGHRSQEAGVLVPSLRLEQLVGLALVAESIVVLGGTPSATDIKQLFPRRDVYSLGYVPVKMENLIDEGHITFDLFFSVPSQAALTKYRKQVLKQLKQLGVVVHVGVGLDFEEWALAASQARAVLDVPQYPQWPWESPMRIARAVRANRRTLSLRPIGQGQSEWGPPSVQWFSSVEDLALVISSDFEWQLVCTHERMPPLDSEQFLRRLDFQTVS